MAGLELRVPENVLQPLPAGGYYQHQLIGCVVQTAGGDRIGEVARVEGGSAGSLLVVNATGGEILIPLAADICTDVDPGNKRITVVPPEGLLELNEPPAARKSRSVKPAS